MIIVGLTGSIGMGKSTAADLLRRRGIAIYDSDREVHRMLARGGTAVPLVARRFPDAVRDGAVDRQALGRLVFGNKAALKDLEAIIHPLVAASQRAFQHVHARRRARLVVLDVPLLYEAGTYKRCDAALVISAPAWLQRQRVMRRPGMTAEKYAAILAQQMPDTEKRRRADAVIPSGLGKRLAWRRLGQAVRMLRRRRPHLFRRPGKR